MTIKDKIRQQFIDAAKKASVLNRGAYMKTAATNTFNTNGTTVEESVDIIPDDPNDEEEIPISDAVDSITNATDGEVIHLSSGEVTEELNINSSITVEGENAGIAQNFNQEV